MKETERTSTAFLDILFERGLGDNFLVSSEKWMMFRLESAFIVLIQVILTNYSTFPVIP
jgi:hypothetical protein